MESRPEWVYKKTDVRHEVTISANIQLISRQCDFCDVYTPPPSKEQLDGAVRVMTTRASFFIMGPVIARSGYEEFADRPGQFGYRPEGWQLLGERSWACPDCVKKAEVALEGK